MINNTKVISIAIISIGIGYSLFKYWPHDEHVAEKTEKRVKCITGIARFSEIRDTVDVIGNAVANESVSITSSVTKKVTNILFKDGQYVQKGDILVLLDSAQEEAEEKRLELNCIEQKREFNRLKPLRKSGVVSEKEYELQRTKMLSAEADLELIRAKVKETKITAPFDGLVGIREIGVGSLVSAGTVITTIDDIQKIKVDFSVPEKYALRIRPGSVVNARSAANADRVFNGEVTAVSARIDSVSRNLPIRSIFNNEELLLRPGMLLKLQIILASRKAIAIPETAVISSGDSQYVFIVQDGIARKRKITIGSRQGNYIEVLDGISENEVYIKDGLISVKDGAKIKA